MASSIVLCFLRMKELGSFKAMTLRKGRVKREINTESTKKSKVGLIN